MIRIIPFLLIAIILQSGCNKDTGRPVDLPKLYPVKITITQNDQPLEGANVTLMEKNPSKYGSASGTTDAFGVAVLRTYGYDGAPAGEFSVMVKKTVLEGAQIVELQHGGEVPRGGAYYSYVDMKFSRADTTTFNITVTDKGATESFDVGAPVHVLVERVPE